MNYYQEAIETVRLSWRQRKCCSSCIKFIIKQCDYLIKNHDKWLKVKTLMSCLMIITRSSNSQKVWKISGVIPVVTPYHYHFVDLAKVEKFVRSYWNLQNVSCACCLTFLWIFNFNINFTKKILQKKKCSDEFSLETLSFSSEVRGTLCYNKICGTPCAL